MLENISNYQNLPKQWPLKLMRISTIAPYFHRAHLLLAADCAAYSYPKFSEVYAPGRTLIIGCPDLYGESFMDRLAEILTLNDILSVTLVKTEAECCRRMIDAAMSAIRISRKDITLNISTVFNSGEIVD